MRDSTLSAKEIFFEAIDLDSPDAIDNYVARVCADDVKLRARVEGLLRAHRKAGKFLGGTESGDIPPVTEEVGTQIGPYKLREQIGEGGFGVVFVAEQTKPMRRKVALKIIKPGMDTKEVIARFETERQALAMMDHPNIARVFDAGATEQGRPYFVMELVRGVPITDYCDDARVDTRQRLKLFIEVCQAVHHAHQKGIIHRDIKPSNVMVSLHDGTPVVKVIDFGVAKAINQQLTDLTVYTRFSEMIGTPMYMSPEQAEVSGLDIDTRTDVYSLGVLLYELLTGTTPFDRDTLKQAGYDEIRRIIREDEPPKPSTRLSTLREQHAASTDAKQHCSDTHRLTHTVQGDLDWIAMKALEKDRVRRYESASAFAQDVERYLNNEAVEACPPSAAYRLKKFVHRNRAALTTTIVIAFTMLVGTTVSLWQAFEANHARREALENLGESETQRSLAESNLQLARDTLVGLREQRELANEARRKAEVGELRARNLLYAADMRSAIEAWREHNLAVVFDRLEAHVPIDDEADVRGFEWHFLRAACRRLPEKTFPHGVSVTDCEVTPDGETLITSAIDGQLRFWGLKDGLLLDALPAHARAAHSIALSPDGNRLVSGGDDNLVHLWDVEGRKPAKSLGMMKTGVETVAWSPDGRWIAAGSRYSEFRVWSADGEEILRVDNDHRHESLAFSPDGNRLYIPTRTNIAIWNLETLEEETRFSTGDLTNVRTINLFGEGKYLAVTERFDKRIAVLDCDSGDLLTYLDGRVEYVQNLVTSPDGNQLASVGPDGMLRLIRVDRLELLRNVIGSITLAHDGNASAVCFAGTEYIVTSGKDGFAKLWRLEQLPNWSTLGPSKDVFNAAYDQTGGVAWTSIPMYEARPIAIDVATREQRQTPAEGGGFAAASTNSVSSDKRWMAIGGRRGELAVWELATERIAARLEPLSGEVLQVEFSPNGRLLAACTQSDGIVIWHTDSDWTDGNPSLLHRIHFDDIRRLQFSPDETQLAATSPERSRLCIWDVQSGEQALEIRAPVASTGLAFHPDGTMIAAACDDRRIRLWSTASRTVVTETDAFPSYALAVQFSPDGRTLLSGHEDGSIRLWHIPSSRPLGAIYQPSTTGRRIRSIEIAPHQKRILAALSGAKLSLLISNPGRPDVESDSPNPVLGQP